MENKTTSSETENQEVFDGNPKETFINNVKESLINNINVLITATELAQSKGVYTFEDSANIWNAINHIKEIINYV